MPTYNQVSESGIGKTLLSYYNHPKVRKWIRVLCCVGDQGKQTDFEGIDLQVVKNAGCRWGLVDPKRENCMDSFCWGEVCRRRKERVIEMQCCTQADPIMMVWGFLSVWESRTWWTWAGRSCHSSTVCWCFFLRLSLLYSVAHQWISFIRMYQETLTQSDVVWCYVF